jgi:nucleoside-diphosphate-sugar epimerase
MDLLVLGGTRFVGRAVLADALARGWRVTAVHRGITGSAPHGTESILVDRTDGVALATALGHRQWDVVVDTWSGAPRVATMAAATLEGQAAKYGYVSSASVYVWGTHVDESSPLVAGDPDAEHAEYPALKRGAELGVLTAFPYALLARAGLILGPHEDIGRLPWWLHRIARGGQVVAPGRPQRPLQYIDVRDLAGWLLSALGADITGAVDVIGPSGFATTESLLRTCIQVTESDAQLSWISEADLASAGVEPWTQLPCWVPEGGEFAGFLEVDTARAAATGLVPRPLVETVTDTWRWLQRDGMPPQRADRDVHGLPEQLERDLLTKA